MLSSESKSPEKERAESGPLMCFQTDTQTDTRTDTRAGGRQSQRIKDKLTKQS